jgi:DNA-binding response OmpR family regulator
MEGLQSPILIVEDMPNVLEFLEVTLSFNGYPVITARNGQEALEVIASHPPAVVISDILMPKMDGYLLAYKLRSHSATQKIPIIFLSATYVSPEDKAFALSLGAVRFLEKPVNTDEFLDTVAEALASAGKSDRALLKDQQFFQGYRDRLETKLRHKNVQIARTERLLKTIAETQKPDFESLLEEAYLHQKEIQLELSELFTILKEPKKLS